MTKVLGKSRVDKLGTVLFVLDGGKFFAKTATRTLEITVDNMISKKGRTLLNVKNEGLPGNITEIEIPNDVLINKKNSSIESDAIKGSIGSLQHGSDGTIYFSLNDENQLVAQYKDKTIEYDKIEELYGKKAVDVTSFGFRHSHIEVPADVVRKYNNAHRPVKYDVYEIGTSPFDGETYYRVVPEIEDELLLRKLEKYFVDFGNETSKNELSGKLTKYNKEILTILSQLPKR